MNNIKENLVSWLIKNGKSSSEDLLMLSVAFIVLTYLSNYLNIYTITAATTFKVLTFTIMLAYLLMVWCYQLRKEKWQTGVMFEEPEE